MEKRGGAKSIFVLRIVVIAILFVALFMLVNPTFSWLRDETITSNGSPNMTVIGTIKLQTVTNFNFYNLTLAPDTTYTTDNTSADIGTYIKTATENDIQDVFVRVKFTTNRSELTLYFDSSKVTTSATYSASDNNKWYYNSTDEYYYYIGTISSSFTQFNAGYTVDNTLNNSKAGADVEIEFIFEGLQKPYGAYHSEWSTAPTIFTTYANNVTGA